MHTKLLSIPSSGQARVAAVIGQQQRSSASGLPPHQRHRTSGWHHPSGRSSTACRAATSSESAACTLRTFRGLRPSSPRRQAAPPRERRSCCRRPAEANRQAAASSRVLFALAFCCNVMLSHHQGQHTHTVPTQDRHNHRNANMRNLEKVCKMGSNTLLPTSVIGNSAGSEMVSSTN